MRDPALAVAMAQNASVLAGLSDREQRQIVQLTSKAIHSFEARKLRGRKEESAA